MVCIRFTSLLLGLLLSWVALGDCIVHAHQENAAIAKNDRAFGGDKELHGETGKVAATRSKWLRGRRMGVVDVVKKEAMKVEGSTNTGKAKNSSKKSFGSSTTNINHQDTSDNTLKSRPLIPQLNSQNSETSSTHSSLESASGAKPSVYYGSDQDSSQTIETKQLLEAPTEIFNMLNKDYSATARRRPPINNHLPLNDEDVEP